MAIDGVGGIGGADEIKKRDWRNATLSEVKNNMEQVEAQAPEVATWAREMAAATNVADTVTYEMQGSTPEAFTAELDQITNDQIAINELPESGQAATPGAVQNAPEAEPEEENPDLGPEDRVRPDMSTVVPPKGEEVPEEEKPDEINPEEEIEEQEKEEQVNADAKVDDLEEANRRRKKGIL